MTITGATLFTGGGGVDIGMRMAGIEPLWGIEYDADICAVAEMNDVPVTCMDLLDADPHDFQPVDVLHASPPCFPDSYQLTGKKTLDCKIIGNAVPPLLYYGVIRHFLRFVNPIAGTCG